MSMNINPSLIKLKQEPVVLQSATVAPSATDVEPVVLSTTGNVSPDQMLGLMATQSVNNGVTINTDKQNQAKLENAQLALSNALKALNENQDPAKLQELQEAVDKASENYQRVLRELVDAGYLECKTYETPETKAGGKTVTEEIYNKGKLIRKTVKTVDEYGEVKQTVITDYSYDINGNPAREESGTYDYNNKLIKYSAKDFDDNYAYETDIIYDKNNNRLGTVTKNIKSNGEYNIYEKGCDINGQPLIGRNGKPLLERVTWYNSDGTMDYNYFLSDYGQDYSIRERYENGIDYFDKNGIIMLSVEFTENGVVRTDYDYYSDGSYKKTKTEPAADGSRIVTIDNIASDGFVEKTTVEKYDKDNNLISRNITENERPDDPGQPDEPDPVDPTPTPPTPPTPDEPDPVDPTPTPPEPDVPKDIDVSAQDATKLLSGLSTSFSLSGWVRSGVKNPRAAIATAIGSMMTQIGSLAGKLKAMGYDSAKVDSAATTLKNYYSALLNTVYDDDNKLQKKGETCATNFTYRDANGKVQSGSSNFRHYAFALEKNANEKAGAGSESASGIVLLENTGINHSYKIAVDMKTVANMLIEFFNAL